MCSSSIAISPMQTVQVRGLWGISQEYFGNMYARMHFGILLGKIK